MKVFSIILLGFFGLMLLSGCSGDAGVDEANLPEAVVQARQVLADRLQVAVGDIQVKGFEAVEWGDACLGVEQPDIMCAQVVTPGYSVKLNAAGKTYEVHTDQMGSAVIVVP